MGNGFCKLAVCCTGSSCCRAIRRRRRTHGITSVISDPSDEGFGHSFCYVRSDTSRIPSSKVHSEESVTPTVTFRSISGASVCANTSTPLSVTDPNCYNPLDCAPATFESSLSFASVPLQPAPRLSGYSGMVVGSGPIERGFLSGPIERGFLSGPLDPVIFSGPLENGSDQFLRSFSHGGHRFGPGLKTGSLIRALRKAVSEKIRQNAVISAIKREISGNGLDSTFGLDANFGIVTLSGNGLSGDLNLEDGNLLEKQNLHWAQGKAGEDRVHVVVSEEHGWVFVGIYDGFNGPDAPDYLVSNLYSEIHKELNGLLWEDRIESRADRTINSCSEDNTVQTRISNWSKLKKNVIENCSFGGNLNLKSTQMKSWKSMNRQKGVGQKCESGTEHSVLESGLKAQLNRLDSYRAVDHQEVLKALSTALIKTEESYLDIADKMVAENPELALMGSCVLVMLMKGDDVYVMNVGDSRAVLAQEAEPEVQSPLRKAHPDLARINEETLNDLEKVDGDQTVKESNLTAIQLTLDHSTCAEEEVQRIKNEHPDDVSAVLNDRVKGSLKVTRAFGAGFLKQAKWNDALLEMFRIEYVGTSPYITCVPSLRHHRLGPKDKFLILSSDGLYQYFTNEEAVAEVEMFIDSSPEADPAQHLVEEVIFRAAKKAGMDFHELLEIPQGDRRRYHDDVSIIIISLEGRIWRSSV